MSSDQPHVGTFTTADVAAQLRASARRFAAATRQVVDEDSTSKHLPDWRAHEIVRHVTVLPDYYREIAAGTADLIDDATQMAERNTANITRVDELAVAECAEHIVSGIDAFSQLVEEDDGRSEVAFQAGSTATFTKLAAIAIGECEVHGLDLAAAIGVPWTIERDAAAMCVLAALPVAGSQWLDKSASAGHSGTYRIKLRGGYGAVHVAISDGTATIHGSPDPRSAQPASTVVHADPVAMLQVFYRRQAQWVAIARGQMLSYGTRPLRALTLKDKFLPI